MLGHTKVVWVIRTFLLRNQRHWTHILCQNMQRLFEWSGHPSWEIKGTRLTPYVRICKGCLSEQDIPPKKSEALDSHPILGHAKVVWVIKTSLLRNQRHWTHQLYWNMQKVVWVIRTSLLKNQRHWTHMLCWDMQRLSEHPSWEIRGTKLTGYVRTCKGCLSDQDIHSEKLEALDSHPILEHAKVVWVSRTSLLRNQRHWTHQLCCNMQRLFEWSGHPFWEIRGTGLTPYVGTSKGCLSDQDIPSKSEALDSHAMLGHAKVVWVIRTSLLRNQRHWTHMLY